MADVFMADVFQPANCFIDIANQSEDDQITNLKLNKLLYYAWGRFLPERIVRCLTLKSKRGLLILLCLKFRGSTKYVESF